jgi:CsoR family transcriptional regulator, copper-sensing transcriptional repressor
VTAPSRDDGASPLTFSAASQAFRIARMIDSDRYCIEVLDQISAVTRGLQTIAVGLLHDHLGHCVTHAIEAGGPHADAKINEAVASISRLMRP